MITSCNLHRLLGEDLEKTVTGLYYENSLRWFDAECSKHGYSWRVSPPWQPIESHIRRCHGRIGGTRLRTAAPIHQIFQIWLRMTSVSFPTWKSYSRAEILVEWGCYHRHGGLLWRTLENLFFRLVKKVGESLGEVYRAKKLRVYVEK